MRQDPEQRLEDYLRRCVEAHYQEQGEERRLRDLGITEEVQMVQDPMQALGHSVLARIAQQGHDKGKELEQTHG